MMSTGSRKQRTVVITGGLGNLGTKLCRHLLSLNDNDDDDDDDNHHGEGSAQTKTNFSYKVILVEHPSFITAAASRTNASSTNSLLQDANVTLLPCNLGNPTPGQKHRLIEALTHADVCVHFSAVNPYPNATWDDCSQSLDHTYYIFTLCAVQCAVRRVIFASSNHVMGGYKDDDHHQEKQYGRRGSLYPYTEPRVGTMPWNAHDIAHVRSGDGKAYGAAKLAGERYARTLGNLYGDVTTFVVLRVGWCQPGENIPATLTAAGSPPEYLLEEKNMDDDDDDYDDDIVDDDGMKHGAAKEDVEQSKKKNNNLNNTTAAADVDAANKDEIWYKQMWLSNRDFLAYFTAAMDVIVPTTAAAAATATSIATSSEQSGVVHQPQQQHNNNVQKGFLLLNAMSRNCNAKWNLDDTEKWLGVVSIDDSMA
jgi:nucleoside-diphosphate-sugar epimerase